jgi:hypothetical protein
MSPHPRIEPNLTCVTDTRIAAALQVLQFPGETKAHYDVKKKKGLVEFHFGVRSERFPGMHISMIEQWRSGELAQKEPLHPFVVMMHAHTNYDALMDMQRTGRSYRLVITGEHRLLTVYREGPPHEAMKLRGAAEWSNDMALTAACGLVGLPVNDISGTAGAHSYGLPALGYEMLTEARLPRIYAAADCLRRAPTSADPYRLSLEDTDPLHPVCLGYDVLHHRGKLKRHIEAIKPLLIAENAQGDLKAILAPNYTGRVMDALTRKFGAPPIA